MHALFCGGQVNDGISSALSHKDGNTRRDSGSHRLHKQTICQQRISLPGDCVVISVGLRRTCWKAGRRRGNVGVLRLGLGPRAGRFILFSGEIPYVRLNFFSFRISARIHFASSNATRGQPQHFETALRSKLLNKTEKPRSVSRSPTS